MLSPRHVKLKENKEGNKRIAGGDGTVVECGPAAGGVVDFPCKSGTDTKVKGNQLSLMQFHFFEEMKTDPTTKMRERR